MKKRTLILTLTASILLLALSVGMVFIWGSSESRRLRRALEGKTLSIMGDSISTYVGVSNSTERNDTIGDNRVYYTDEMSLGDTWWMRTADKFGMELLVNNSYSGSTVSGVWHENAAGCGERSGNLHDNTLSDNPENAPIMPDIIAVYLGMNDLAAGLKCSGDFGDEIYSKIEASGAAPESFEEAYALMIYKIKAAYPNSTLFCFNIPENSDSTTRLIDDYNAAIGKIAEHYGATRVNIHASELSDYSRATLDGTHPTVRGMEIMHRCFAEALGERFLGE